MFPFAVVQKELKSWWTVGLDPACRNTGMSATSAIALGNPTDRRPAHHLRLTPRQREILYLAAKGLSNREIAGLAGLSERIVKREISGLLSAFEASNRTELATLAAAG